LADRLESDADLRREECLVSEGCRFGGTHTFEGAAWSAVSENMHLRLSAECPRMSAGVLEELRLVRGCPRDSHLLTLKGTDLVRACPRSVKKCYGGLYVVRGCPRGVKVGESRLSADSRQVFIQ